MERSLFVTAMMVLAICTRAPAAGSGTLEPFGLQGLHVTSLGTFGSLYAGTLGDGVYRRTLHGAPGDWASLGLQGKRIRAVYPHASGPLGFATTVGLQGDPWNPDSALIYCSEMDSRLRVGPRAQSIRITVLR